MKTQTFTMHLYQRKYEFDQEPSWVLSEHDFMAGDGRLYIGPREITVEVPEFQDMREHQLKTLREKEKELRAEFTAKIKEVQDRINSLLALEMA